jgi:hypothetical protein
MSSEHVRARLIGDAVRKSPPKRVFLNPRDEATSLMYFIPSQRIRVFAATLSLFTIMRLRRSAPDIDRCIILRPM